MSTSVTAASPGEADANPVPLVAVDGLTKRYHVRGRLGGALYAVDGVTFRVEAGETFAVVGETGSGKSTIGRLVLALEPPSEGTVRFDGNDLSGLSAAALRSLRRQMQPVSQDPYSALNGRMRVREILAEPYIIHRVGDRQSRDATLRELLDLVGLSAQSLDRYPHEFSGGQRQRLVIARAIALRPRFLLCDEPLSALDVSVQSQIINLLRKLQRELGLTYLFISHDLSVVRYLADRVSVMYRGRQVESGPAARIFERPFHPYTQALLAAVPVNDPSERRPRDQVRTAPEGEDLFGRDPGCPYAGRCPLVEARCRAEVPEWREIEPDHRVACHVVASPGRSTSDRNS